MANLTSQPCGDLRSWVDACPAPPEPFKGHLSTRACQTGLRNKPQ